MMSDPTVQLSELDRTIINRLSGDLPSGKTPFDSLAADLGITETDLLARIESYAQAGMLRRSAAILAHRKAGFAANAMVVWRVPEKRIEEVASVMVGFDEVSHCYERVSLPEWPYNIYTMIHGRSRDECLKVVELIAADTGIAEYRILFTAREFKK